MKKRISISIAEPKTIIKATILLTIITTIIYLYFQNKFEFQQAIISILKPYYNICVSIAYPIIRLFTSITTFENSRIIIKSQYYIDNATLIDNWEHYLLFLKWTVFIIVFIWILNKRLKTKIIYTAVFGLVHFISVITGLVLIAGIGPSLYTPGSLSKVEPQIISSLIFYSYTLFLFKSDRGTIENVFAKYKIPIWGNKKKTNEFFILFALFLISKNFLIPFFNWRDYIYFLLSITKIIAGIFGYEAAISGPYLIGIDGGALYMEKWCLGFITMLLFASLVFLTRNKTNESLLFILFGLIVLQLANIIRLVILFIFVQHYSSELTSYHHEIYNIVFYFLVFVLWAIWFNKVLKQENPD